jgi:hypothetical protein
MTIWQFLDSEEGRRDPWSFPFVVMVTVGFYAICCFVAICVREAVGAIKMKIIENYEKQKEENNNAN